MFHLEKLSLDNITINDSFNSIGSKLKSVEFLDCKFQNFEFKLALKSLKLIEIYRCERFPMKIFYKCIQGNQEIEKFSLTLTNGDEIPLEF